MSPTFLQKLFAVAAPSFVILVGCVVTHVVWKNRRKPGYLGILAGCFLCFMYGLLTLINLRVMGNANGRVNLLGGSTGYGQSSLLLETIATGVLILAAVTFAFSGLRILEPERTTKYSKQWLLIGLGAGGIVGFTFFLLETFG